MYINEDKILKESKALIESCQEDGSVPLELFQKLSSEYETLLSEIKFITKISDRLQNKLNTINENLLEQTVQLETAQKLIINQNDELKQAKENLEQKVQERTHELRQANDDLKITNRELDTFVYRASHDIKGPIMSMLGLCNLAEMEAIETVAKNYFRMLSDVAKQLQNKLNRLLTINNLKKTAPSKSYFQLQEVFDNSISSVAAFQEQDYVDISIDYPQDLELYSDIEIIQVLFDNVMEYAIKNMPIKHVDPLYIRMKVEISSHLEATFSYNGIKIPESVRENIFKMFYRTTNNPELTGMELYTAYLAADKLGGIIELITSERDETSFRVAIPSVK